MTVKETIAEICARHNLQLADFEWAAIDAATELSLDEYQCQAMSTCLPSSLNSAYMLLGLGSEVGELQGKAAKAIRKEVADFKGDGLNLAVDKYENHDEFMEAIKAELGDVAWFVAGTAAVFGMTLSEVCKYNVAKLASRKKRGVIQGDGDKR